MSPAPSTGPTANVPLGGNVVGVLLSLASTAVLTIFLTQRISAIVAWNRLPFVVWLVFAIYFDSLLFIVATAVLVQSLGVNKNLTLCGSAIILCLCFYVTTKLIYLFLVEKAYHIRGVSKPRLKSKLYLFNSFGMLGLYIGVVCLNFSFRITELDNGVCIIGMRNFAMIPLISFDAVVNIYLTFLFLVPFKNLYSFKHMPRTRANVRLRTIAMRTFVGSLCTLTSSIVNLTVLMALRGEPGWICMLCCNGDILFSSIVIQWVTSRDNAGTHSGGTTSQESQAHRDRGPAHPHIHARAFSHSELHTTPPSTIADVSLVATKTRSNEFDVDRDDSLDNPAWSGKNATSVMVTTTIKHESEPREIELDSLPRALMRHSVHGSTCPGAMASGNPTTCDQGYPTSQTRITAGSEI